MTTPETDGQIAYEAYSLFTGGRSIHNEALPTWVALSDNTREAWEVAAKAVLDAPEPAPSEKKGSSKK